MSDWARKFSSALNEGVMNAAARAGADVVADVSDANVPQDTGALLASRDITVENGVAALSYGADYATYVHEDLTDYHPNGSAKFLENAMESEADRAREAMAEVLRRAL